MFRLRKVSAILLTLAMLLSMVPGTVFASDAPISVDGAVAEINGNGFETLQAAVNAAAENDTITLLKNVEQSEGVLVSSKKLTIDLNGKTFTVTDGSNVNNRNIKIDGASVVTVKNGTMIAEGDYSSGAYGTIRTEGTANVTLQNLKLYNYRGNGLNVKACAGTTVNMTNVEVYAQYGGGIEAAGGTIELNNVTVEQKGMYTAPYNSMAISVNGGGKVTVNSGTYSTECLTAEEANNQGTSHGPWVAGVLNSGGTLIIKGGNFSNDNFGDNALATAARGLLLGDTYGVIEVYGGNFQAVNKIFDLMSNLAGEPSGVATVYGGTYSTDPLVPGSWTTPVLGEGYKVTPNADGTYSVVSDSPFVAQIGTEKFEILGEALKAVQEGQTIVLLADAEIAATTNINTSITIDGNGHKIVQAEGFKANGANVVFDIFGNATVTFENLTFDAIKNVGIMRTVNASIVMDNCVVHNCEQTVSQGLLRLACGNATITNSKFLNNDCKMVLTFGYDAANDTDVLVIDGCTFEGNTCGDTAVVYFAAGDYGKVMNTKFIDNAVSAVGNAATLYMGWGEGFEVSGCLFDGNEVTTTHTTTKRFASAIFADGCAINGNVFGENTAIRNGETITTVVAVAAYYGAADIGGNFWGGEAPVPGVDYTVEYTRNEVTVEDYYTTYENGTLGGLIGTKEYVAEINGTKYETLQDAIDAAGVGDTITLLTNVEYVNFASAKDTKTSIYIPAGKEFTLDLNGYVISGENDVNGGFAFITICRGANITIDDTSANKTGKITYKSTREKSNYDEMGYTIRVMGALTLNGGTIENSTPLGSDGFEKCVTTAIDVGNASGAMASFTMNGGVVISNTYFAIRANVYGDNNSSVTNAVVLNGGTVYGLHFCDWGSNGLNYKVTIGDDAIIECGNYVDYLDQSIRLVIGSAARSEILVDISENAQIKGTVYSPAAKVGSRYFYSLQKAIDAAGEGDTIELLANIELTTTLALGKGKTITIDGKGHKITPAADFAASTHGAVIVFADGDTAYNASNVYTLKNLTIEGFSGLSRVVRADFSEATIRNCTFINNTVSEGVITSSYANLNVEGNTFTGNNAGFATLNIGFNVSAGTELMANIADNSFTGNSAAIAVIYLGSSAEITGNSFSGNIHTGDNANAAAILAGPYTGNMDYTIEVNENAFVNAMSKDGAMLPDVYAEDWSEEYGVNTAFDFSNNYWNGGEPNYAGSGNPEVALSGYYTTYEDGVLGGLVVPPATEVKVSTLEELLAALADNSNDLPIVVTQQIVIPAGATVTIDLNGKTVTMVTDDDAQTSLILNNGNLTVIDSGENGKLSYQYTGTNTKDAFNTIETAPGSVLTVKGGIIENLSENCLIAYAIDGLTNGTLGDVTVNIEGGTITSKKIAVRIFANSVTHTGYLNISGGDISGRVIVQSSNANANKAVLTITGGNFESNGYKTDVLYVGGSTGASSDITASVSGGNFNGEILSSINKTFITGGTFSTDVTEFCVEGYKALDNGDGTYRVLADGKIWIDGVEYIYANGEPVRKKIVVLSDGTYKTNYDGMILKNHSCTVDGVYYEFGEDGRRIEDKPAAIIKIDGVEYIYKNNEPIRKQIITLSDGHTYKTNYDGKILKNHSCTVDGKYYVFGADGRLIEDKPAEIVKIDGVEYIYKNNEPVRKQIVTLSTGTYKTNYDGMILKNHSCTVDGVYYVFGADGRQVEEDPITIVEIDGVKYIYENGQPVRKQIIEVDGKTYKTNYDGKILTNHICYVDGVRYEFGADGVRI